MSADHLDLADIKAFLSSGNPLVQSQGLAGLLTQLKPPFINAKLRINVLSLFFDCFTQFKGAVSQWCAEAVPGLIDSGKKDIKRFIIRRMKRMRDMSLVELCGLLTWDEVFTHCVIKLCSDECNKASSSILIRVLLHCSPCLTSTSFAIIHKCKRYSGVLLDELVALEVSRCLPTLKILLCSGVLSHSEEICLIHHVIAHSNSDDIFVTLLLEHFPLKYSYNILLKGDVRHISKSLLEHCTELPAHDLDLLQFRTENAFLIADSLSKRPEMVMNKSFPKSHVLLPSLLSLYSSRTEIAKSLPTFVSSEQLKTIKAVTATCQTVEPLSEVHLEHEVLQAMSTYTYLQYVSSKSNMAVFLDVWRSLLGSTNTCEQSLTFAAAFLPYCEPPDLKKCFNLIQELVQRFPEAVTTFLMFYSMLFAKPYIKVDRCTVLNAIRGLFINRFVVTPAVNFLSIVCRQPGEERNIAYSLLSDLVTKFPTAFDIVKPLAIIGETDSFDLLKSKLNLMTALCIATDRSDELLPSLSALLKNDAVVVDAAMDVVLALCKEEILDVSTIRKQLRSRVRQSGFEVTLAGYCSILAISATQCGEDEMSDCITELCEITQMKKNSPKTESARSAAWAALGFFDVTLLKSAIDISGNSLLELFKRQSREERKGFVTFLRKLLSVEVESLSRSLYTKLHIRKSALANFAYVLHNTLGKSNQEAPWFWMSSLPLSSIIIGEYGEGSAALQATKLMRRLLREVRAEKKNLVNLFAGWRICIASLLSIQTESGDVMRSRDSIVEECRRALKSSEFAVNNVVIVLAVLAGELKRIGSQLLNMEANAAFDTAMRPWSISLLEFLFPLVLDEYTQTTQPLIQIAVNRRCVDATLARSAVWMACSVASNEVKAFFKNDVFSHVSDWRMVSKLDPEGKVCDLLTGEEPNGICSLQRSELWLLAASLGADEIVTNSLSLSLSYDETIDDAITSFLNKSNLSVDEIKNFFYKISNLPLRVFNNHEKRLRKRLDQLSVSAGEEMKRAVYEGLSKLASVSLLTSSVNFPADCSHLPENSVLRAVIEQFCEKAICDREGLHALLPILVGHVRSDGRRLPPLDLQFMLSSIDFREDQEARSNLLALAFEQKDSQIIYELTSPELLSSSTSASYWLIISKNLQAISVILPAFRVRAVVNGLVKFALDNDDHGPQIFSHIRDSKENQVVYDCLIAHVPKFASSSDLLHKILNFEIIDSRFKGHVSRYFDFWLECSGLGEGKMSSLVDMYVEETAKMNVMLSIFGYCSVSLSLGDRLDKLVNLMSIGKMMLTCQRPVANIEAVMRLFLALICSSPSDIPLHWLSEDIVDLVFARWRYYWKKLVEEPKFCDYFDVIVAFLFPSFLLDDLARPVQCAIKGMLLYILALRPDIVRPYMDDKRAHWERLIL